MFYVLVQGARLFSCNKFFMNFIGSMCLTKCPNSFKCVRATVLCKGLQRIY